MITHGDKHKRPHKSSLKPHNLQTELDGVYNLQAIYVEATTE